MSAFSVSRCVLTDTYSPPAIENAPATRAATPAVAIAAMLSGVAAATPMTTPAVEDDAVVGTEHARAQPVELLTGAALVGFVGMGLPLRCHVPIIVSPRRPGKDAHAPLPRA
ncbi:Uncharacterised protein [Brevibacterium casei]|uniref:Uncharacterized protein n=1 Tax=Brevibacterium casei TaxID=33889 RepID=A0A449CYJ7_9MICO|nr:Uncharacterised protein [Brevibacterium casei]